MFVGYERYAICWVPPHGDPLARFGCGWTGWCADTGEKCARIASPVEGLDLPAMTRDVSRYGLHGVLKAPFRLNDPRKYWMLERTLAHLADRLQDIAFRGFDLAVVDGRVALVPRTRIDELDGLTRRTREAVEPLALAQRQTAAEDDDAVAELAARHCVALRPSDCFHLPLTDRLPPPTACQVAARLRPAMVQILEGAHVIADVALVADPGIGRRARVEERYPLSDQVRRGGAYTCRGPRLYAPLTLGDLPDFVPV